MRQQPRIKDYPPRNGGGHPAQDHCAAPESTARSRYAPL